MEKKGAYECEGCGETYEMSGTENTVTDCCGRTAKWEEDSSYCSASETAEHSRVDTGDACDDGRSGM